MADAKAVREWARIMGIPVGARGRLDASLFADYAEAHGEAPPAPKGPRAEGVAATTCITCKRQWTSFNECHCDQKNCHQHFLDVDSWDAHRVTGKCISPDKSVRFIGVNTRFGTSWRFNG